MSLRRRTETDAREKYAPIKTGGIILGVLFGVQHFYQFVDGKKVLIIKC